MILERIPITDTTTISSTRVKPKREEDIFIKL
jgi:hypothetical protein